MIGGLEHDHVLRKHFTNCISILDFDLGFFLQESKKGAWLTNSDSALSIVPPPRLGYAVDFAASLLVKDKNFLYQEYVVLGKSTKQIAREQGCAASTVSKYLYEYGIPPRATGLPHQRRGQIPYGSRMVKGRLVEHKGEQAVIAQLIELRKQGKSFGDLVAWLEINQIKTKSKAARWDRPTVYKILARQNRIDPRTKTYPHCP
jgi:hypothetical protein